MFGNCDEKVKKARDKISGRELFSDITVVLREIIGKSGRDDFNVFLTGYPTFFNADIDLCEYSTFYYWQPGYHGIHHIGNWAYLYKDLRKKLNDLVSELNRMLSHVADAVNQPYLNRRVKFVDPNPIYDGHRFCEKDGMTEVKEPDEKRRDTWLFLSGWPDNDLPGSESAAASHSEDHDAVVKGNNTAIPDAKDCPNNLGKSTDWADRILCDSARAVAAGQQERGVEGGAGGAKGPLPVNPPGVFKSDLYSLKKKDYEALDVPW